MACAIVVQMYDIFTNQDCSKRRLGLRTLYTITCKGYTILSSLLITLPPFLLLTLLLFLMLFLQLF